MNRTTSQHAAPAAQIAAQVRRSLDLGEFALARPAVSASAFMGLSMVCVAAMAVATALSANECRVKPIALAPGQVTDVVIAVPARTPCTMQVRLGSAMVDELAVTVPPSHGALTPRGRTGVIYRPDRGFRGEDTFVFSLQGTVNFIQTRSESRVRATVN